MAKTPLSFGHSSAVGLTSFGHSECSRVNNGRSECNRVNIKILGNGCSKSIVIYVHSANIMCILFIVYRNAGHILGCYAGC